MEEHDERIAIVVQPDGGEGYWQPEPASGYAEVRLGAWNLPAGAGFSSGVQVVPPGGHIRDHAHAGNEELFFFWAGRGRVIVDGTEHPVGPGVTAYVGRGCRHAIVNDGTTDLKLMWVLLPGGIESFFKDIGRPRRPGAPAPRPFPRPADADRIRERAGVS